MASLTLITNEAEGEPQPSISAGSVAGLSGQTASKSGSIVSEEGQVPAASVDHCLVELKTAIGSMAEYKTGRKNLDRKIVEGIEKAAKNLEILCRLLRSANEPKRDSRATKQKRKRGERATPSPNQNADNKKKKLANDKAVENILPRSPNKEECWSEVVGRKEKKKKKKEGAEKADDPPKSGTAPSESATPKVRSMPRIKPEAVLVQPAAGRSFADVLVLMKTVDVDKFGVGIKGIRETRKGGVLVELRNASPEKQAAFTAALNGAVDGAAVARSLIPRVTYEIRDIDVTVTKEEVEVALKRCIQEDASFDIEVRFSGKALRGNRVAWVSLNATAAKSLRDVSRLKVGWVNCRIRAVENRPARCYRCLGFGHLAGNCKGVDRTGACWRCGEKGRVAGSCSQETVSCYLCGDMDPKPDVHHAPGSTGCAALKAAGVAKRQQKWR